MCSLTSSARSRSMVPTLTRCTDGSSRDSQERMERTLSGISANFLSTKTDSLSRDTHQLCLHLTSREICCNCSKVNGGEDSLSSCATSSTLSHLHLQVASE